MQRKLRLVIPALACAVGVVIGATTSASGANAADAKTDTGTEKSEQAAEALPALDMATLEDPANIEVGKELWQKQCRHCHGRSAYPGKAPKLKPRKYEPVFVYDRVTNGFRKMPAWKEIYTDAQRVGLVAWVMSKKFSP